MLIRYVGGRSYKRESVTGLSTEWHGPGFEREVDDDAAAKLLKFPAEWVAVPMPQAALAEATPKADEPPAEPHKFVLDGPEGPVVLDTMTDKELRQFASSKLGMPVDGRWKGDRIRTEIMDFVAKAGGK